MKAGGGGEEYLKHFNYKSLIKSIIRALEKDFRKSL